MRQSESSAAILFYSDSSESTLKFEKRQTAPEKLSEVARLGLAARSATERRFSGGVGFSNFLAASGLLMFRARIHLVRRILSLEEVDQLKDIRRRGHPFCRIGDVVVLAEA